MRFFTILAWPFVVVKLIFSRPFDVQGIVPQKERINFKRVLNRRKRTYDDMQAALLAFRLPLRANLCDRGDASSE